EHDTKVQHCAVLPDGRMLTIAGNTLRLWPADGGTPKVLATDVLARLLGGGQPLPLPGDRVGYIDTSGRVAMASLSGQPTTYFDHQQHVSQTPWGVRKLVAGPDFVATAGDDGVATVELHGNTIKLRGHVGAMSGLEVAADGRTIVTAGDDGTARGGGVDETPAVKLLAEHTAGGGRARLNDDGTRGGRAAGLQTARVLGGEPAPTPRGLP